MGGVLYSTKWVVDPQIICPPSNMAAETASIVDYWPLYYVADKASDVDNMVLLLE